MKRYYLVFIMILVVSLSLNVRAQHRIGIIGGINMATMNVHVENDEKNISGRTDFGAGALMELEMKKSLFLHCEALYLQKGGILDETIDSPEAEFSISFLEIPLFLKAVFGKIIKPYVFAGPTVGINLTSEAEFSIGTLTFEGSLENVIKKFDIGLGFGVGISYPVGTGSVFFESRYVLGLNDISKSGTVELSSGSITEDMDMLDEDILKTKGLQIMVGISFPFWKK